MFTRIGCVETSPSIETRTCNTTSRGFLAMLCRELTPSENEHSRRTHPEIPTGCPTRMSWTTSSDSRPVPPSATATFGLLDDALRKRLPTIDAVRAAWADPPTMYV